MQTYGIFTIRSSGYVALMSVLIISAVTLLITLGAASRSLDETQSVILQDASTRAFIMADYCAEYALMRLLDTFRYAGGETLANGDYTCDILIVEGTGNLDRVIKAQSAVGNAIRKVRVEISRISPIISIEKWHNVADF
jgi:hypothetical protein